MSPLAGRGGIFICYRREEAAALAGRLFDHLSARYGADRVFMDVDSIAFGVDFTRAVAKALSGCDILLALIGGRWLAITDGKGRKRIDNPSDLLRLEIEAALQRDIKVVPVLVDGAVVPYAKDLPPSLQPLTRRQALELRNTSFRSDLSRLMAAIDKEIGAEQGRSVPSGTSDKYAVPWHSRIRVVKVGALTRDTEMLIALTHESHTLVARYGMGKDLLKVDGKVVASSLNNLDGTHAFSMSDGPRLLDAQVELQCWPPEKMRKHYKVLRLVVDRYIVPSI